MRISDWSSDVCSSDLDLVHHRHRLRDAEPRAAIFLGHGDAEPTAVGHGAVEIFRKLAAIVAVEPIFIVVGRADGAHALADRVEIVLGGQGRSEEHTSELQSLMRISYAVLCLKQKKQYKYQSHAY